MNTGKKIFCRAFQEVMHTLIPVFPYREPELLGGTEEIAGLLKSKDIIIKITRTKFSLWESNRFEKEI